MTLFLDCLLNHTVFMSAAAIMVLLSGPQIAKRYRTVWRYYIWLVLVVGFLVPIRLPLPESFIKVPIPAMFSAMEQHYSRNNSSIKQRNIQSVQDAEESDSSTKEQSDMVIIPKKSEETGVTILEWTIFIGWSLGMVVSISNQMIKYHKMTRLIRRWGTNNSYLTQLLEEEKRKLGVRGKVGAMNCPIIKTPMETGFFRPVILLPERKFTELELRLILKHELVHKKRCDLWYKLLVQIVKAVFWFDPVVYVMAAEIESLSELSCDVVVLKSRTLEDRKQYAEMILSLAREKTIFTSRLATNFEGGKKDMRNRITALFDTTEKKAGITVLVFVILLLAGTGSVFAMGGNRNEPKSATIKEIEKYHREAKDSITKKTSVSGDKIAEYALKFKGNPYQYGGTSLTKGADSSGFIMKVYSDFDIKLPRTVKEQSEEGKLIETDKAKPGDLVFYGGTKSKINHSAIYIGDGKVIHASSPKSGIKVSSLNYRTVLFVKHIEDVES